jgi:hypothetical protein
VFGAFFTLDGGAHWIRLKGGLPTIAVRDMVIQPREGDLIVATFGRGFYILDDITPLRRMAAADFDKPSVLWPVKDALMYVERHPLGGPKKGYLGDAYFTADNPPYGAIFTTYLREKLKTKKEKRQDAEKEAAKKGQTAVYPTNDDLRAEGQEAKPEMYFMVYDESGAAIRRVDGGTDAGFQRVAWDLRYAAPSLHEGTPEGEDFPPASSLGPLVVSGAYSVRAFQKVNEVVTELAGPQAFKVVTENAANLSPQDRAAQEQFLHKVSRLYRAVSGAIHNTGEVQEHIKAIRQALRETPAAGSQLGSEVDAVERQNRDIQRALQGDAELAKRSETVPNSINDRMTNVMEGERFSIARPTQTHIEAYNIAAAEFAMQLAKLKTLVEVDMAKVEKDLESAGAPWTPGRVLEWQPEKD